MISMAPRSSSARRSSTPWRFTGKTIGYVKIVTSGAGAAALACLDFLVDLGAKSENIFVTDIEGVVYRGRKTLMNGHVEIYAKDTNARTLADVIGGADIFLGLSAGGVLTPEMVKADGRTAADHGARQSDSGNRARRCASRRGRTR